eukprot:scaffold199784_cov22-Prasinocladus_malaysianus.AAC.1
MCTHPRIPLQRRSLRIGLVRSEKWQYVLSSTPPSCCTLRLAGMLYCWISHKVQTKQMRPICVLWRLSDSGDIHSSSRATIFTIAVLHRSRQLSARKLYFPKRKVTSEYMTKGPIQ